MAEIARQGLEIVPGVGICCEGAVRSILLVSRKPWREVKTVAADESSRTSTQLARVILRERFGVSPRITSHRPALNEMLEHCDAALLIGDPALAIDPADLPFDWLDLGEEWHSLTQLPMVFAAWAGKPGLRTEPLRELTTSSYEYGSRHLEEIVLLEAPKRKVSRELAHTYLTRHIHFELAEREQRGLATFLDMVKQQ